MDSFLALIEALPNGLLYLILGISAFTENVFPPIPGDTITAFGAFLVGTRRLSFLGVFVVTTLGSVGGFLCLFWVGGRLGRAFFLQKDYRFFKARDILRAEAWFQRRGYLLILGNRFFPGIRSVISLAAGISGLRFLRVTLLSLVSASVWNLVWIALGHFLGSSWETVQGRMGEILARYNLVAASFMGLVALVLVLRWVLRRRSGKDTSNPEQGPTLPLS